jgi:hypothetical protein
LLDAARLYQEVPTTIKLRELQTIAEVAREGNTIVVTNTSDSGDIAALTEAFTTKNK